MNVRTAARIVAVPLALAFASPAFGQLACQEVISKNSVEEVTGLRVKAECPSGTSLTGMGAWVSGGYNYQLSTMLLLGQRASVFASSKNGDPTWLAASVLAVCCSGLSTEGRFASNGTGQEALAYCDPGYVATGGSVYCRGADNSVASSHPFPSGAGATPTAWFGECSKPGTRVDVKCTADATASSCRVVRGGPSPKSPVCPAGQIAISAGVWCSTWDDAVEYVYPANINPAQPQPYAMGLCTDRLYGDWDKNAAVWAVCCDGTFQNTNQ